VTETAEQSITRLVGNTPLVQLQRLPRPRGAEVWGKLESRNPSGSVKDRVVLGILQDAARRGELKPGDTVVEASAGSMAVALALMGPAMGYQVALTMPEGIPLERRRLLMYLGADIRASKTEEGMKGAQALAAELAQADGYFYLRQFESAVAVQVHREGTAREILEATAGRVDAFVAGVGTGATITGVGGALKQADPSTLVVAVEPLRSPLLSRGWSGEHGIPGLGPDFVPPILDRELIDEVVTVSDDDAAQTMRRLAEEGLLVGPSSGANTFAALRVALRLGAGKRVVTVWPDTGERHLSLPL